MRKKPLSRRQALRAFTAEQCEQQQKPLPPYSDDYWRCRRLTPAEMELMRTPEEVAAEIRAGRGSSSPPSMSWRPTARAEQPN
jgi:hypothetical protein